MDILPSRSPIRMLAASTTGIGVLALSACGGSQAAPAPTVTVTSAATVTASPATSPTSMLAASAAASASPVAPGGADAPAAGTKLGAYTFDLTQTFGAPLGATAPTRVQIS